MTSAVLDKLLSAMQDSRGVPACESSVVSILGALDQQNEGKAAVVDYIIGDFALTQRVLKLANSSMYSPFGAGAPSVSAALEMLDSEALMHLVLSTELASEEEIRQDPHLWRTLLASELARNACTDRAEDASIATLMYDIGRLMTGRYLPHESHMIASAIAQGQEPEAAATRVLGMSYQEIGVELATRWNLPHAILSTIDGTGDPRLVKISRFSSTASSLIQAGKSEEFSRLLMELDDPQVDKTRVRQVAHRQFESVHGQPLPAATPVPDHVVDGLLSTMSQEKGRIIDTMANTMLPTLAETLQAAHCLLFMMTRSGEFRIRAGYGDNVERLISGLRIPAQYAPTAFHVAIRNNTEISIPDVSRLKATAVPAAYRDLLPDAQRFLIVPIANTEVSGLIYCDWAAPMELSPAMLEAIRKLRNLFAPFFP